MKHASVVRPIGRIREAIIQSVAIASVCVALADPATADITGTTLGHVTNLSAPIYPRNLTKGADGAIWFSEEYRTPHTVGYFTPSDGKVTSFPVPCDQCDGNGTRLAYIDSMTLGPDGNAWFAYSYVNGDGAPLNGGMNNFIGRVTPTGQFTSFAMPTMDAFRRYAFGQPGHSGITSGPDGNLWFTENATGKVGKITPTGTITEYALGSTLAAPSLITTGPDGNLWFAESRDGKIGRMTPGGALTLFSVSGTPFAITTGPDGNLWYTDWSAAVGRITPAGVASRFSLEPGSQASGIATGPDGKLYFPYFTFIGTSGAYQGKIAQIDPSTLFAPTSLGFAPGKLTFTKLPNGDFGSEIVGSPLGMIFSASGPDGNGIFVDRIPYVLNVGPTIICPEVEMRLNLAGGEAGAPFWGNVDVTGEPNFYKVEFAGLPKGVSINTSFTATINSFTGTVDKSELPGQRTLTVTVTDSNGCKTVKNFTYSITGPLLYTLPVITIAPVSMSGVAINGSISAPGATAFSLNVSPSPDMSNPTTSLVNGPFFKINETVATPTPFFIQAIPKDGSLANVPSAVDRVVFLSYRDLLNRNVDPNFLHVTVPNDVADQQVLQFTLHSSTSPAPAPATAPHISADPTFTASVDEPFLDVSPTTGTIPSGGVSLTLGFDPKTVPAAGTSTGTLKITTSEGTTTNYPVSISIVSPVRTEGRTSPPPNAAIVPAVVHAAGANNSFFRSDVRITSPVQQGEYQLTFTPTQTDGTQNGLSTILNINANQTLALDDILRDFFGFAADGDSPSGSLEIRPLTGVTPVVTSRTYSTSALGTLGQFVPGVRLSSFFTSADGPGSIQQIANSGAFRTNFGFVEGSGQPVTIAVRVFDSSGHKLVDTPLSLQAAEHRQMNLLAQQGTALADGRMEFSVTSPAGSVTAYASVIDNVTNDPLLVSPVRGTAVSTSRTVLPGVADLQGAANFHTDMRVYNASTIPVDAVATFYPLGAPGNSTSKALRINGGETRVLDDVLPSFFGLTGAGGAVAVTTATNKSLVVSGRTYSRAASGTYGQFIPGVTDGEAAGAGTVLRLTQIEQSSAFRTNVGIVEVTGNPATVEITATTPDGKVSPVLDFDLQPNELRQFNGLLLQMGYTKDVYNARITLRMIGGSGKIAAYASVIDNRTQDPTYIPAQ